MNPRTMMVVLYPKVVFKERFPDIDVAFGDHKINDSPSVVDLDRKLETIKPSQRILPKRGNILKNPMRVVSFSYQRP